MRRGPSLALLPLVRRPGLVLLPLLLVAGAAWTQPDTALEAELLVRQLYYEGLPYEQARRFDARAVERLGAMLREPSLSEHHANAILALGLCGHPHAFALLDAYAREPLSGEVDRATFRARTRLAQAMGHLARSDRRALSWLLERSGEPAGTPDWRFRHHAGPALARTLDEQVLTGLALSGAPEALAVLREAAAQASGQDPPDLRLQRHVQNARRTHRRVSEGGVEALFLDRRR